MISELMNLSNSDSFYNLLGVKGTSYNSSKEWISLSLSFSSSSLGIIIFKLKVSRFYFYEFLVVVGLLFGLLFMILVSLNRLVLSSPLLLISRLIVD